LTTRVLYAILISEKEKENKTMYQIRMTTEKTIEYSQVFASEWAANYVAIQVVHANLGVTKAEIVNRKTGKIEKTYMAG
jgi:hypothetical protein